MTTSISRRSRQLLRLLREHPIPCDRRLLDALLGQGGDMAEHALGELTDGDLVVVEPDGSGTHRCRVVTVVGAEISGVGDGDARARTERVRAWYLRELTALALYLNGHSRLPDGMPETTGCRQWSDKSAAVTWFATEWTAISRLLQASDDDTWAWMTVWASWDALLRADMDLVEPHARAAAAAESEMRLDVASRMATRCSWGETNRGEHGQALAHAERAVWLAHLSGSNRELSTALSGAGRAQLAAGNPVIARRLQHQSLDLAQQAGDVRSVGLRKGGIADTWKHQQNWEAAHQWYQESSQDLAAVGDDEAWARNEGNRAEVLLHLATPDKVLETLIKPRQIMATSGSDEYLADLLAIAAQAHSAKGEPDAAEELVDQARELYLWAGKRHAAAQLANKL